MALVVHRHDPPDRFVTGTVGPPGQRTFFLQARTGERITSVSLEKEQVAVLAERINSLLDQVARQTPTETEPADDALDTDPLDQPIVDEFRVGTMTLAWDVEDEVLAIEVFPVVEVGEAADEGSGDDPNGGTDEEVPVEPEAEEVLLVRVPPTAARRFAARALTVVSAGRPPCPFCGGPLDPEGHLCPRANGFRRTRQ
jgi:uncharacterized repeat protein (TIGR03847 family)